MKNPLLSLAAAVLTALPLAGAYGQTSTPVAAIASLDVPAYMGTWYQVAWFPNRFQKQCVSDTTATYQQRPDGHIVVINRCKTADGRFDDAQGLARPAGSRLDGPTLKPAQLEVSFLPSALRWLPIWGNYWVLKLADDGRYAVIGEPSRQYLWVLSRTPQLAAADESEIRSVLSPMGYDLGRWQVHLHAHAHANAHARGPQRP
jgi:apolipoprotein D and lipocalin family protein